MDSVEPSISPGGGWMSGPMQDPPPAHPAAPIDPPDDFEGDPTVGLAVHSLIQFGGPDTTREEATVRLRHWRYYGEMSPLERTATLRRFPSTRDRSTCRHCGTGIRRAREGTPWTHTSTDTATGTPHITCGFDGERGTSAEPTRGKK